MGETTQSIRIDVPREQVYAVITDFERYPEFLSEIRSVAIATKSAKQIDVTFNANIFVPLSYTLRVMLVPPTGIRWTMLHGQVMRTNAGEWRLAEVGPRATEATYSVEINFGPLVPGIVTSTLIGSILPTTLRRFKERAEQWRTPMKKTLSRPKRARAR